MAKNLPENSDNFDDGNRDDPLEMERLVEATEPQDRTEHDSDNLDDSDEFADEFSLDQLSAAYARVIKANSDDAEFDGDAQDDRDEDGEAIEDDDSTEKKTAASAKPAVDDNAGCPITPESIVESILFVGAPRDNPLTPKKIAALLRDVSPNEIKEIVKQLNARYESEQAAYRIDSSEGTLRLILHDSLNRLQQEFYGRNKSVKLSQTSIDVLAVVAYNQPVTRDQIDSIRGKSSGGTVNQLVKRGLLMLAERTTKSEPVKLLTTERFLDFFGLAELDDLPQSHEVSELDEFAD